MTTHPLDQWMTATEYRQPHGFNEFVNVVDSLGRIWNPLLHPRDRHGRFIRTFSFVNFSLPDGTPVSGRVSGINQDGNLLVKVKGVGPGAPAGLSEGSYVEVPHDKVDVQTIKAQLSGRGSAGTLNGQESRSVSRGAANLRRLGLHDQADQMDQALQLANTPVDRSNPKASEDAKNQAIELLRGVGESLGEERGKGFAPGTDYNDVKADLSSEERARLQTLDQVMGTTFTARHSLGDRGTLDAQNDEGPIHAKKAEVRVNAAQNELQQDFSKGLPVWDMTSGELKQTTLEAPVQQGPRDTVAEQQGKAGLPALERSTYQKLQTGLSRLSGWKQAQQVAPSDRFHVDKNGDEVVVGHVVTVDPTKSRAGFTGLVSRIYTDAKGGKHVYARDFDPDGSKGYDKGYKDFSVQGGSIELADEGQQSAVFKQLAQIGAGDASKALLQSFTSDYLEKMRRRYASPDAKRISPTGGFFDVAPVQDRVRADANGEALGIGDHAIGPNGEVGVVTYIEPNENTVKVQYPNGQVAVRVSSRKMTRLHGPQSEVYLGKSGYGDNNYVPTREEAARIAEGFDSSAVADSIRNGDSPDAIQQVMTEDPNFQKALADTPGLFDRRDQALSAGKELSPEDSNALHNWDRLAAASAGQFREGDTPPTAPTAPTAGTSTERPGNPANPTETVSEGGVTVRTDGESVVVGDNTEDPIPSGDATAVDEAVKTAEEDKGTLTPEAPPEAPAPRSVAERIVNDLHGYAGEIDNWKNNIQKLQMDKHLGVLDEAIANKDGEALVKGLKDMTRELNTPINRNIRGSKLGQVLNGAATNGTPLHEFIQGRLDSGANVFDTPAAVTRADRPEGLPNETPEGVDPKVDSVDNAVAEALTMGDGSTLVMQGDQQVNEGFYVVDPSTVTEFDNQPTQDDITQFLNEHQGSDAQGLSVWFDETTGRYNMAKVDVHQGEQDARDAAANIGSNQYVNIADGMVYNIALGGDPNTPTESIADPRSEDRVVRTAGSGKATARTTSKQKSLLDHVGGLDSTRGTDVGQIVESVKNGEEITGADASRLADFIDGLDAGQFDKPSDKGVASQMAHRLARAAGEEGARGYSSQNTALRRTSDVGISLTAQSQDPQIRQLMEDARTDIKNGDFAAAAEKFRLAGARFGELGLPNDAPARRATEHADRLDAMGGTTGPAAEGAPVGTPGAPPPPDTPQGEAPAAGDTPSQVVKGLLDQIGQPAEYGTEYQGRMLGQAVSRADAGLPHEAADALDQVAKQEPQDSTNLPLIQSAANTLRGMPEMTQSGDSADAQPGTPGAPAAPTPPPPEPPGGGGPPPEPDQGTYGGPPESSSVSDALASADSYLDSEVQAEGDNGPQGWTPTLEEIQGLINDLQKNPNDTGIATQLRQLASEIEDNFTLTDPSTIADELRKVADAVDAGTMPGGGPEAGGGGAPFRSADPTRVQQALLAKGGEEQAQKNLEDWQKGTHADYQSLLSQVEEGSLANREVNQAKRERTETFVAADDFLENLRPRIADGSLTDKMVRNQLAQIQAKGVDPQDVLDVLSGIAPNPFGSTGKLADFMKERADKILGQVEADGTEAGSPVPTAMGFIRANLSRFSSDSSRRMETGRISTFSEYAHTVDEMNSTMSVLNTLGDPKVRVGLSLANKDDIPKLTKQLSQDAQQVQAFYAELADAGIDSQALRDSLAKQLGRFDAAGLLDMSETTQPPQESWLEMNRNWSAYRQAIKEGKPGDRAAIDALHTIRDVLATEGGSTSNPQLGGMLADQVRRLVIEQMSIHNGQIPDPIREILQDPAFHRFGAFADVTQQMDMQDLVKGGEINDLLTATGGRYDTVTWDTSGALNPDLIADDRKARSRVEADILFQEGVDQITPNVANALNSLWATIGGGIHRTSDNITEANTPDAERWRAQEGWGRTSGSDARDATDVGGVYTKSSNNVVVADSVMHGHDGFTNTLVHESGHALDSMLADINGGTFFSHRDPEFVAMRAFLLNEALYGATPDESLMHWYFRDEAEGATMHNGTKGPTETFAEGYAAYAWARARFAEMQAEGQEMGPITRDTTFVLLGRALTKNHGDNAIRKGDLSFEERRKRELAMGKALYDYYEKLETERLPKLMNGGPRVVPVNSALRDYSVEISGEVLGAPPQQKIATTEQKVKANSHNSKQHGLIHMQQVERGSPEWTTFESAVKQHSPGASMPPPTALYVTWNPQFVDQGVSVIWKAVMPGIPKYTVEYTDQHKATQLAAKFQRQQRVNDALDEVHRKAEAAALSDETAALVLAMIETGMRVGSSEKAGSINRKTGRKVPTFGGATMQVKHVFFPSSTLTRFRFPGKAGKVNTYESRNPELRRVIQQLMADKRPSDQVFSGTNADRTIAYLRQTTGIEDIINHDTRTRYATNMARELVAKVPKSRMPKTEAEFKKWQAGISKTVGAAINDTWQVARDSYISPAVWEPLERSAGLPFSFDDSPPYGLIEGGVVTEIYPTPGGPPVPGITPGEAPGGEAPAAPGGDAGGGGPVAAAAVSASSATDPAPQTYAVDQSPSGVAERKSWYDSYVWPAPPIVAAADVEAEGEEVSSEPAAEVPPAATPAQ